MIIDNNRMTDERYIKHLESVIRSIYGEVKEAKKMLDSSLMSKHSIASKLDKAFEVNESLRDITFKYRP